MNFEETKEMITNLHSLAPKNCVKLLVANKIDLEEKREVSKLQGKELASFYGFSFFEVSSLGDRKMVDHVFTEIGRSIDK